VSFVGKRGVGACGRDPVDTSSPGDATRSARTVRCFGPPRLTGTPFNLASKGPKTPIKRSITSTTMFASVKRLSTDTLCRFVSPVLRTAAHESMTALLTGLGPRLQLPNSVVFGTPAPLHRFLVRRTRSGHHRPEPTEGRRHTGAGKTGEVDINLAVDRGDPGLGAVGTDSPVAMGIRNDHAGRLINRPDK
jgi:hypothetical protein